MAVSFACPVHPTAKFTIHSVKLCNIPNKSLQRTPLKVPTARKLNIPFKFKCKQIVGDISMHDKWVEFPHLSFAGRSLMEGIASTVETQLGSQLNPSYTPADVRSFKNADDSGEGSVNIKSGKEGSKVDFLLGSWLHCKLPFGALNIATIVGMVSHLTDTPHLLFEFIQSSPSSLVLVLDLLPRKDLVLEPEYLQWFYEDTKLDVPRQTLEKAREAQPYVSSSLYVRSVVSPTAILFKINSELQGNEGTVNNMDKVVKDTVEPVVKEVIGIWLEAISARGRSVQEHEQELLLRRDNMIKTKGVELDLSSNMPRLFGQDVADRVVAAFRKGI